MRCSGRWCFFFMLVTSLSKNTNQKQNMKDNDIQPPKKIFEFLFVWGFCGEKYRDFDLSWKLI